MSRSNVSVENVAFAALLVGLAGLFVVLLSASQLGLASLA